MKRRIKKADIKFVSFCKKGKNRQPVLFKDDGSVVFEALTKASPDFDVKGELLTLVYVPENEDADGDVASHAVVRKMAHSFLQNGASLDIRHDGKKLEPDQAFVAESFIVQKGDSRFSEWKDNQGNPVDAEGAWGAIFQINDPALRKNYLEEGWDGVSLFGPAEVEYQKAASDEGVVAEAIATLKKLFGGQHNQDVNDEEIDMKPEELAEAMKGSFAALSKSIVEGVARLVNPPKPTEDEVAAAKAIAEKAGLTIVKADEKPAAKDTPLKFEGDPTKAKDIKAHKAKVLAAKALEEVDFNDPEQLDKHLASLEKSNEDAFAGLSDSEKVDLLMKENNLLRKGSKASGLPIRRAPAETVEGLEKEEQDAIEVGAEMAEIMNKEVGWGTLERPNV